MSTPTTLAHATVIRNISGHTMFFAYLGINGAYLADQHDYAVPGNVWDLIARSTQKVDALRGDLEAGRVVIMQTPFSYIFDTGATEVVKLKATSGVVAVDPVLPSGSSYVGPAPNP